MKPINPNHHYSNSGVVSVLDHLVENDTHDPLYFDDLKDDNSHAINDTRDAFKFNYTNVNHDTDIVECITHVKDEQVNDEQKVSVIDNKYDCQSVVESVVESEFVKESVKDIKKEKKEVKIIKVNKKEKKIDKKPPIPKPKEEKPKKEEKTIERLNLDDLVVEKKTDGIK